MSEIFLGWLWFLWSSPMLTYLWKESGDKKSSVSLPRNSVCFPLAPPNRGPKKQENPVVIFRSLPPLPFGAPSAEHVAPSQMGSSSACIDTPLAAQEQWGVARGGGYWCLFIGGVAIYFLFFHSAEDCSSFSAAILSSAKQKKHKQKASCVFYGSHSSFLASLLL